MLDSNRVGARFKILSIEPNRVLTLKHQAESSTLSLIRPIRADPSTRIVWIDCHLCFRVFTKALLAIIFWRVSATNIGAQRNQNSLFWKVVYIIILPNPKGLPNSGVLIGWWPILFTLTTMQRILHRQKGMESWACSRGGRCKSRTILSADNFRKGPTRPQANQYFRMCNICRQRPLCSLNTGEIPSTVRCTSCYDNRELQDFIDDNGDEFW